MRKALLGVVLLLAAGQSWAAGLDLALSNETANLAIILNTDPFNYNRSRVQDGGAEVSVGGFISEKGDNIVFASLMARGYRQTATSQYFISAGMKLTGGNIEIEEDDTATSANESVGALALGFQAGLLLRPSRYNPVELNFEGFYAPSITSFTDAERYTEVTARLQVEVMPRAKAYVGYRRMEFDTNDFDDVNLDRNAHFGLNITF